MEHFDERAIEHYVLRPDDLSPAERTRIENHLASCPVCRTIHAFLKTFHEDLSTMGQGESPRVAHFIKQLFPLPPVVQLKPFRYTPDPSASNHFSALLAAMTGPETAQRFSTVCTLASEEEQMVVRIVYDSRDDLYKLYVLTDDPRTVSYAIVSIPELHAEFVTDERGRAEFRVPDQKTEWDALNAVLRTSRAEHHLSGHELARLASGEPLTVGGLTLRFYSGRLNFERVDGDATAPGRVVATTPGGSFLLDVEEGAAGLDLPALPAALTIRLYA